LELDNSILGLATIRRNRGISLEQISESTKISLRSLKAIECGEFAKLPGGIYNTSYIRQYARAIDFDESELLAFYNSKTAPNPGSGAEVRNGKDRGLFDGLRPASILR
jgi:cytoskeletal protein RodZ